MTQREISAHGRLPPFAAAFVSSFESLSRAKPARQLKGPGQGEEARSGSWSSAVRTNRGLPHRTSDSHLLLANRRRRTSNPPFRTGLIGVYRPRVVAHRPSLCRAAISRDLISYEFCFVARLRPDARVANCQPNGSVHGDESPTPSICNSVYSGAQIRSQTCAT